MGCVRLSVWPMAMLVVCVAAEGCLGRRASAQAPAICGGIDLKPGSIPNSSVI